MRIITLIRVEAAGGCYLVAREDRSQVGPLGGVPLRGMDGEIIPGGMLPGDHGLDSDSWAIVGERLVYGEVPQMEPERLLDWGRMQTVRDPSLFTMSASKQIILNSLVLCALVGTFRWGKVAFVLRGLGRGIAQLGQAAGRLVG